MTILAAKQPLKLSCLILPMDQENGGFVFRTGAQGGGGGGSAYGDIFSGQATAEIVMFNTAYGPRNGVGAQVSYALTALHEILHLAGGGASAYDGSRGYYMDVDRKSTRLNSSHIPL